MTTAPSRACPTSGALPPNLPNLSARPRARRAAALPDLPDLSGSRVYGAGNLPSSHHITPNRLGRLGRLGGMPSVREFSQPNLNPTSLRSGSLVGMELDQVAAEGRRVRGTAAVERGSSPGGTILRAASARNQPSFCGIFLVNFNGLRVQECKERLK